MRLRDLSSAGDASLVRFGGFDRGKTSSAPYSPIGSGYGFLSFHSSSVRQFLRSLLAVERIRREYTC
jgi:hypothetical protein